MAHVNYQALNHLKLLTIHFEKNIFRHFPAVQRFTSLYDRYEPIIIIKTDEGNIIKLLKIIRKKDKNPKKPETKTSNRKTPNDQAQSTSEVRVQMYPEDHETTGARVTSEHNDNHSTIDTNLVSEAVDKSDPKKEAVHKIVNEEDCLRIFPVLNFCHSVYPEMCHALKEISAENVIKEQVPELNTVKKIKVPKRHNKPITARQRWSKLLQDIKDGKLKRQQVSYIRNETIRQRKTVGG